MIADRGFDVLKDAGGISGNVRSSFGVDEPSTVREMLEWIDSLKRRTILPDVSSGRGPSPVCWRQVLGHLSQRATSDRYLNSLHYGDAALGEFFEGLRARQLDDRTSFVVQGDHGEAFGQHPDNFAHSLFIYDENIRVPYLIAAPGLITARSASTRHEHDRHLTDRPRSAWTRRSGRNIRERRCSSPKPGRRFSTPIIRLAGWACAIRAGSISTRSTRTGRSCSTCAAIPTRPGTAAVILRHGRMRTAAASSDGPLYRGRGQRRAVNNALAHCRSAIALLIGNGQLPILPSAN